MIASYVYAYAPVIAITFHAYCMLRARVLLPRMCVELYRELQQVFSHCTYNRVAYANVVDLKDSPRRVSQTHSRNILLPHSQPKHISAVPGEDIGRQCGSWLCRINDRTRYSCKCVSVCELR